MILHENSKSIIQLDNNKVIKHLKNTKVSERWFKTYKRLSKNNPLYVKVLEFIDDQTYTMEYISEPFYNLENFIKNTDNYNQLNKDDIINIASLLPSIFLQTLSFSKSLPGNEYFIHTDMLLPNFIFTQSKKIIIMDPDSFTFVDDLDYVEKYYMTSINVMYNIQKILYYKGS